MIQTAPRPLRVPPRSGIRTFGPHHRLPVPTTLGWALLLSLALTIAGLCWAASARADEPQRFVPTSRGERAAAYQTIALERAEAHGADGRVIWRVVSECEVPSLDPHATGDGGTSHGFAQLNELQRTGNLLGHFYSLGYTDPYDPYQAFDYLARAFAGQFVDDPWGHIGPWRWSCYRSLFGGSR